MDLFRKIYTKDSPEIKWIEETGISQWRKNGMKYGQPSLKKISIIGNDAAATFRLSGSNEFGKIFIFNVEVLYVKVDSEWKIESTGAR